MKRPNAKVKDVLAFPAAFNDLLAETKKITTDYPVDVVFDGGDRAVRYGREGGSYIATEQKDQATEAVASNSTMARMVSRTSPSSDVHVSDDQTRILVVINKYDTVERIRTKFDKAKALSEEVNMVINHKKNSPYIYDFLKANLTL